MSEQPSTIVEEWRAIPNYEGVYSASNLGRIRRDTTGKILKPHQDTNGYMRVNLWRSNKMKCVNIHRLVLLAFFGSDLNRPEGNHKDGNKTNNALSNLEWCTTSQNIIHSLYVLRGYVKKPKLKKPDCRQRGENHYAHRITDNNVVEIHKMRRDGMSQSSIGRHFGISQAHVSQILLGRKWKHVDHRNQPPTHSINQTNHC